MTPIGLACPPQRTREATNALEEHEAILIQARDGGFVLLGLREYDLSLFCDLPWSTPDIASLTLTCIQALGWSVWTGGCG